MRGRGVRQLAPVVQAARQLGTKDVPTVAWLRQCLDALDQVEGLLRSLQNEDLVQLGAGAELLERIGAGADVARDAQHFPELELCWTEEGGGD